MLLHFVRLISRVLIRVHTAFDRQTASRPSLLHFAFLAQYMDHTERTVPFDQRYNSQIVRIEQFDAPRAV